MAKLIGPLFSQEARGAFARSIVFNRRRGQNIARSYVVPANPQTANQIAQRIRLAVGGLITRAVRATDWTYAGQMQTWIEFWRGEVREGEVWNAAMVGAMMGPGNATYIARLAQYEALDANVQALWVAEAAKAPADSSTTRAAMSPSATVSCCSWRNTPPQPPVTAMRLTPTCRSPSSPVKPNHRNYPPLIPEVSGGFF